jgi:hypothetical protein
MIYSAIYTCKLRLRWQNVSAELKLSASLKIHILIHSLLLCYIYAECSNKEITFISPNSRNKRTSINWKECIYVRGDIWTAFSEVISNSPFLFADDFKLDQQLKIEFKPVFNQDRKFLSQEKQFEMSLKQKDMECHRLIDGHHHHRYRVYYITYIFNSAVTNGFDQAGFLVFRWALFILNTRSKAIQFYFKIEGGKKQKLGESNVVFIFKAWIRIRVRCSESQ